MKKTFFYADLCCQMDCRSTRSAIHTRNEIGCIIFILGLHTVKRVGAAFPLLRHNLDQHDHHLHPDDGDDHLPVLHPPLLQLSLSSPQCSPLLLHTLSFLSLVLPSERKIVIIYH